MKQRGRAPGSAFGQGKCGSNNHRSVSLFCIALSSFHQNTCGVCMVCVVCQVCLCVCVWCVCVVCAFPI